MAKKVNGFLKPVDKIINAKCKGLAKEKNANKFRINWSYSYPEKITWSRASYPQTWGGSYGQWEDMRKGYLIPARNNFTKNWMWKKGWDPKTARTPLFNRADWFPYTSAKLKRISMGIYGHNDAGSGPCVVLPYYEFSQPAPPSINGISYNDSTGNVSTTIKFKQALCVKQDTCNLSYRKVVRTYGIVYNNKKKKYENATYTDPWTTTTREEVSVSYGPSWAKNLSSNQYAVVEWQAYTNGIAGKSCEAFDPKTKKYKGTSYVIRKYVYAWPAKPTIRTGSITYDKANNMLKIPINTNHNANRNPVDKVTLQYNNSTTITKAENLGGVNWQNVENMEDNANCAGFVVPTQDIAPEPGLRLWVRVRAEHGSYIRYSDPVRVDKLYVAEPSAASDKCAILAKSSADADGKGITLVIGLKANDGDTGTEITWSTYNNAWSSNEEPSKFNATWAPANNTDTATKTTWPKIQTVHIRGLEQGQLYYVRARRYHEGEVSTTYGSYAKASFTPMSEPAAVWLTLPEAIPYGSDLPVSWGYDSDAEQKSYSVYDPSKPKQVWASGTDANGYVVVPWAYVKDKSNYPETELLQDESGANIEAVSGDNLLTEQMSAQGTTINLCVTMSTGGKSKTSPTASTQVTRAPKAAIEIPLDGSSFKRLGSGEIGMVSQGGNVVINSTAKKALVNLTILSDSVIREFPDGSRVFHNDGDVVWAFEYSDENLVDLAPPVDQEDKTYEEDEPVSIDGEGGLSRLSCALPSDLDLVDGVGYTMVAMLTDLDTGLTSAPAVSRFFVEWAHKPVPPDVTVVPSSEDMTALIGVWKPEGAANTDVADIYRVTPDGAYLIASGIAWGSLVLDRFAPYANDWGETLYYRVSTRTADGAEVWTDDAGYSLYGYSLRFDWEGGETLELPYNLSIGDTWSKGFEARKHMDGLYGGYFDGSVMRTASISTDMIKVSSDEDKRLVRQLAAYSGPVFVRTPIGSAYTANVVPNNMTYEYNNPIVAVSFDITEFALTDQFRVLSDDVVETGYLTYQEYLASLE